MTINVSESGQQLTCNGTPKSARWKFLCFMLESFDITTEVKFMMRSDQYRDTGAKRMRLPILYASPYTPDWRGDFSIGFHRTIFFISMESFQDSASPQADRHYKYAPMGKCLNYDFID